MTLPTNERPLLLHNPRCSKSRTLQVTLEQRGVEFDTRLYLDEPLTEAELAELHRRLGGPAAQMVRSKEAEYAAAGLDARRPRPRR